MDKIFIELVFNKNDVFYYRISVHTNGSQYYIPEIRQLSYMFISEQSAIDFKNDFINF